MKSSKTLQWGPGGFRKPAYKKSNIWLTATVVLTIVVVYIFAMVATLLGSPYNISSANLSSRYAGSANKRFTLASLLSFHSSPAAVTLPVTETKSSTTTPPVAQSKTPQSIGESHGVTVTSPKVGDSVPLNKDFLITWQFDLGTIPISENNRFGVYFARKSETENPENYIAKGLNFDIGMLTWSVAGVAPGDDYYIIIKTVDGQTYARSGLFSIASRPNLGISIIAPTVNEGHKLGDTMSIRWCATGEEVFPSLNSGTFVFLIGGPSDLLLYENRQSGMPLCSSGQSAGTNWTVGRFPRYDAALNAGSYKFLVQYRRLPDSIDENPTPFEHDYKIYGSVLSGTSLFISDGGSTSPTGSVPAANAGDIVLAIPGDFPGQVHFTDNTKDALFAKLVLQSPKRALNITKLEITAEAIPLPAPAFPLASVSISIDGQRIGSVATPNPNGIRATIALEDSGKFVLGQNSNLAILADIGNTQYPSLSRVCITGASVNGGAMTPFSRPVCSNWQYINQ